MSSFHYPQFENERKPTPRMDVSRTKEPAANWNRQGMKRSASCSSFLANVNRSRVTVDTSRRSTVTKIPEEACSRESVAKKKFSLVVAGKDGDKRPVFADRFIPLRATSNFDVAKFRLSQAQATREPNCAATDVLKWGTVAYERLLREELSVGNDEQNFLSYSVDPSGHDKVRKVGYTQGSLPPSVQKSGGRFIATRPDRILDAPDLVNDFFLHPIDWSINNHVAVALFQAVYIWNAGTFEIHHLANVGDEDDYSMATAVSWVNAGTHLAVGTSDGEVWIYDVAASRRVRRMRGHTGRVTCLAWNEYVISSGSACGAINHYDVRVADFKVSSSPQAHSGREVCGLTWSPDQRYLASGGNDNAVHIWVPGENGSRHVADGSEPLHVFTHHQDAVKALAWCPWKPSILASGGFGDRAIRVWNVASGNMLEKLDTQAQISALAWSEEYHEIVSTHGYPSNQVLIWRFPGLEKVARLDGHRARVHDMSMSPDKTTIVTAGADETLRVWKCFAIDEERKKAELRKEFGLRKKAEARSVLVQSIR